ncbi:hypothetical protein [Acidovorax radicis]|uniref:hypothetical protein n=1 Tax=Acidovorax radicis TaxID=758826 RepID=UPI001CFC052E|nr:hypothetical protein [Acidovorax radicis]UCV01147.1 hypothetical protein KI609_10740 [Acidovorax radicis]
MAAQFSTAVRNAFLDSIETTIGTSPKLQIRTGAAPANCAAADSGTLLAEITCPADWMGAASAGAKALAGSWTVAAGAAGTAGHYRLKDNSATTCHEQGSITATGGGGDMTLDNTSIASGQTVTITAKTLTAGGA